MFIEVRDLKTGEISKDIPKSSENSRWIILIDPSESSLSQLGQNLAIPFEDLEDALDEDERPRIEIESDINLIKFVFRVPADLEQEFFGPTTNPVVVLLHKNDIIQIFSEPISYKKFRPIRRINRPQSPVSVFLDFLAILVKSFELTLDILDVKIHRAEEEIFKAIRSKSIFNIFEISKQAIYLDASLKGNLKVYQRLPRLKIFQGDEETLEDLDDLCIDLEQQVELMSIYRQLIEGSLDAYASVISNNQNELLKIVSVVSFVLLFPTLVASLYGMNVTLPFEEHPFAFIGILLFCILGTIPLFALFKYKKWI